MEAINIQNSKEVQQKGLWSIKKASDLLEVSLDTIRRWEKKGLIKAHRDKNRHRFFEIEELNILKQKLSGESTATFTILKSEKRSNFSVIELFAGAGGLALGMENSGLNCNMLVEIDKEAVSTLERNRPKWNVINDGFVEGFNNKVKVLKRRCYGIFNLKHLFQRIFLDFSGRGFLSNNEMVKI